MKKTIEWEIVLLAIAFALIAGFFIDFLGRATIEGAAVVLTKEADMYSAIPALLIVGCGIAMIVYMLAYLKK
jgi:hypothetical protein